MPPQTPILLCDNVFDTVQLYPSGVVSASSERTGHEAYRVASYRRERSSWQVATIAAGHSVQVDLGASLTRAVDSFFLDRGHNLWGKTITIGYSTTGVAPWTTYRTLTVPVAGTLGGDPTSTVMAVTEEGACWAIFVASAARRAWQIAVVESLGPVVPGIILGTRMQLSQFSTVFDEDAGERTEDFATSRAGYRGYDTTYSWRTLELGLAFIGGAEYDAAIRAFRDTAFKRNQPFWACLDYGTRPERGWLYQYDGKSWGMPKKRVYRGATWRAREVGASLS
jgi:hypothetical protein